MSFPLYIIKYKSNDEPHIIQNEDKTNISIVSSNPFVLEREIEYLNNLQI